MSGPPIVDVNIVSIAGIPLLSGELPIDLMRVSGVVNPDGRIRVCGCCLAGGSHGPAHPGFLAPTDEAMADHVIVQGNVLPTLSSKRPLLSTSPQKKS